MLTLVQTNARSSTSVKVPSPDLKAMFQGGTAARVASAQGNGLNYAFGIFLAGQLGINDFGLYALRLTIFNALGLLVLFSRDTGVVRFVIE